MPTTPKQSPPGTMDVAIDPASQTAGSTLPGPAGSRAAAAPADAPAPYRLRGPRRRTAIILGISSTALITALAVTLLYVKWYRAVEYDSMIIAVGEPAWEGATVRVTGPGLSAGGLSDKFRKPALMVRFHVPAGSYVVTVTGADGKPLARRVQDRLPAQFQWWPLRQPGGGTATAPSAAP